jgi:hypothetical protein
MPGSPLKSFNLLYAGFLPGLLFNLEEDDMFLKNIS